MSLRQELASLQADLSKYNAEGNTQAAADLVEVDTPAGADAGFSFAAMEEVQVRLVCLYYMSQDVLLSVGWL